MNTHQLLYFGYCQPKSFSVIWLFFYSTRKSLSIWWTNSLNSESDLRKITVICLSAHPSTCYNLCKKNNKSRPREMSRNILITGLKSDLFNPNLFYVFPRRVNRIFFAVTSSSSLQYQCKTLI